jgi:acyl-CoA reductase-like NAD-dependent aldehyde dehydrogenase
MAVHVKPAGDPKRDARPTVDVENPATGEVVARVPRLGADEVAAMVERARAAQPAWAGIGFDGRGRILRRAQKWVADNADRIADTIVSETGKTREDALLAEVGYAASAFGFWAKQAPRYLEERRVRSASPFVKGKKLVVRYQPLEVVGVIGPWNFPLTNSFGDCIPALAAGASAVLKPSELTPLTSLLMRECLLECGLPEDVYQVATGQGSTAGAALIDAVDFVQFTGSTETGKQIMARAAETLTPVGLELGGKDPLIVLSDANLERAANAAVYYSMSGSGQVCISVERVYVEEPAYDEFVAKVTEKAASLRQGVPAGPGSVDVGAMVFPGQIETIERHLADAVEKGARVLTGGEPASGPGRFFAPTVVADVNHDMLLMREETFGPTLPVMKVADADEAVRLANDSPFGLQASVWTRDTKRGEELARRIQAGACCVNDTAVNYFALELPMGGWKASGLGSRHGEHGIRKYCAEQAVVVTRFAPNRDVHMFPYRARTTRLLTRLIRLLYGRGRRD